MDKSSSSAAREPTTPGSQTDKPLLITSKLLGDPPYVLEPDDLPNSFNPFPDQRGSQFRQIDDNTLVKYGSDVCLSEAEAMDYVSKHTNIACPKVSGAYILNNQGYILMSFEQGQLLHDFWPTASEDEREMVIERMRSNLNEMRSIKGDYVGGFNRTPCVAGEFAWDLEPGDGHQYGPYLDERGFNDGIIEALCRSSPGPKATDPESAGYNNLYSLQQLVHSLRDHEIVFTHGDLNAGNILIREDLSVVILDWQTAGFYPAYWEWYKATWIGVFTPSFIRQVERYIPPYWIEARIMRYIFDRILG